jgi:hypothetical protein
MPSRDGSSYVQLRELRCTGMPTDDQLLARAIKAKERYEREREQARDRYASVLQTALDAGVSYRQLAGALGVRGPSLHELLHPRLRQRLASPRRG